MCSALSRISVVSQQCIPRLCELWKCSCCFLTLKMSIMYHPCDPSDQRVEEEKRIRNRDIMPNISCICLIHYTQQFILTIFKFFHQYIYTMWSKETHLNLREDIGEINFDKYCAKYITGLLLRIKVIRNKERFLVSQLRGS